MFLFCIMPTDQKARKECCNKAILDEQWLSLIAQNDRQAFEKLYRATDKTLFAYILSILRNTEDAQDVMQDTYLKIRASAHLYTPQGKPLAWILTIAKNLSFMKLREQTRKRTYSFEETLTEAIYLDDITNNEDTIILKAALTTLNDTERQIILLHAISGLKHHEIADILHIPLSTSLSKYHRALAKLKKQIEKEVC
ncbi:RNA polymerase sigma factor [Paludicola sp. MB14-C6]|uniref:RNA polymerase sigma factor n=1 Tax=Paludihabitans sp. MB14-C6 TaxID=3070656 RepID=UPI0027DB9A10|nr:RNA polymerase sigma factor [Paludicola sp. MB14-C6]WMJ23824.1 RNA polymerase sigma factor [Paludicola sp. MB14-C6]